MKILSITAQKPNSTGSGVYLTELVKGFAGLGHSQAVIAGVYQEDKVKLPEGVLFYPAYFKTQKLPFAIAGMSDEMPYESTVYGTMTPKMTEQFKAEFGCVIQKAVEEFNPDLVLCHHLYLLTALARELLLDYPVYGFSHNTDLRQMKKIPFEREYIRNQIQNLDRVFALHEEQKKEILSVYGVQDEKVKVIGTGYNSGIFYSVRRTKITPEEPRPLRLIFAGKLSEKKGVMSLLKSLSYLPYRPEEVELRLAGGYGSRCEYEVIRNLAETCPYPVKFLGRLPQEQLAREYNDCDIFILPSFYEGMPLTVIEAMACGDQVIVTDLPGIQRWISEKVKDAPVRYVAPPVMRNTDEAEPDSLEAFERELALAVQESAKTVKQGVPDLSQISWDTICEEILVK